MSGKTPGQAASSGPDPMTPEDRKATLRKYLEAEKSRRRTAEADRDAWCERAAELLSEVNGLSELFRFVWNEMATLESPDPAYSYISVEDQQRLEDLCLAIERAGLEQP